MRLNDKQIQSVLALSGPDRYRHFIKVVVDREQAWGLYDDGWALSATDDGQHLFPLWPASEYASLCADENWSGYEPASIPLTDLIDELVPKLKETGVRLSVFNSPDGKGVVPEFDEFLYHLNLEMEKYL